MADPQAVPGAAPDKFRQGGMNQLRNAAFGISTVDWLRDTSGGKDDVPKAIRLSIQQQYFTYGEAFYFAVTAFLFGAGIWTMVFKFMGVLDFDLRGDDAMEKLAFFFLGFWLSSMATMNSTRGQKMCDTSFPEVKEQSHEPKPCVDDYDCVNCATVQGTPCGAENKSGTYCNKNSWKGWRRRLRMVAITIPLLLFIVFLLYALYAQKDAPPVTDNERFVAVSFGMGFGAAFMFIIS